MKKNDKGEIAETADEKEIDKTLDVAQEKSTETVKSHKQSKGYSRRKIKIKKVIPPLPLTEELEEAEVKVMAEARKLETELQKQEAILDEKHKKEYPNAGHRQRVKHQFQVSGVMGMSEHRALEFLLFFVIPRKDVAGLASDLVNKFGGFANVLRADFVELCTVKGVGDNTALFLNLIPEMLAYFLQKEAESIVIVNNMETAFSLFHPLFLAEKNEMIYILCLTERNEVLGIRKIAEGSMFSAGFHFRRIATEALNLGAVKLYIAHNHMTGSLDPSAEDWSATEKVIRILNPLDIYVMDHLIIGRRQKVSMRRVSRMKGIKMPWPAMQSFKPDP